MAGIVNKVHCFSSVKATAAEYLLYPLGLCKLLLLLLVSSDHEKHATLTLPLYPASSGFSRPEAALRRATVCFSIELSRPRDAYVKWRMTSLPLDSQETMISDFRSNDATATKNFKKTKQNKQANKQTIGLINKTKTLHEHHTFFVIFFFRLGTTMTWKCRISRFMENVNKLRRHFISLVELGYSP